jgi:hypothetical protein
MNYRFEAVGKEAAVDRSLVETAEREIASACSVSDRGPCEGFDFAGGEEGLRERMR